MYHILTSVSSILNMIIRASFYDHTMHRKEHIKRYWFWISSVFIAIVMSLYTVLFAGEYSSAKLIITMLLNLFFNLSLSFFYKTAFFYQRILISVLYYSISIISEFLSASLLYTFIPEFNKTLGIQQDSYVCILCDLIMLIIVNALQLLISIKKSPKIVSQFSALSLRRALLSISTPAFSVIIAFLFTSFQKIASDEDHSAPLIVFFIFILLLNMINFILLRDISKLSSTEEQLRMQKKQLALQSANYDKISHSYRQGRRIIHEMKRFNNYILACAERNECDKIIDYIHTNNIESEKRLKCINTGSLVIDSMVSSYSSMAENRQIGFDTDITIDSSDIPLSDYDLCIIIGNLLDNAFNAVSGFSSHDWIPPGKPAIHLILKTKPNFFVLHIENPCIADNPSKKHSDTQLTHGYGLLNVKEIVKKYNGIYFQEIDDSIYKTTVSIPIIRDSVGAIILQQASLEQNKP